MSELQQHGAQKLSRLYSILDEKMKMLNKISNFLHKANNRVLQSNGFLTKKGGYICKAEVHAIAIPSGFLSSSYMVTEPLGIVIFSSFFLMWRKGFNLAKDPNYEGHWNDVIDESAYTAGAMAATIIFFELYTVYGVSGANQISGILSKILFGV